MSIFRALSARPWQGDRRTERRFIGGLRGYQRLKKLLLKEDTMFRRLALAILALGLLASVSAPRTAAACPDICVYENGHWHCGCP